jgi:predicted hotdog family 3-hydroxylacyl-ACP dehydratase
MSLDRTWITAHIPHQGAICLIDEVIAWTDTEIRCLTASHRLRSNPLRTGDCLRSECGIEYAAQAIAIHGALCAAPAGPAAAAGMLASAREVVAHVARLDDVSGNMLIHASRISGDATALLYVFSIADGSKTLLAGRATIVLRPPSAQSTDGSSA